MVLLAIVDAEGQFLYADVGGKGGVSDGGILRNSELYHKIEERIKYPRA